MKIALVCHAFPILSETFILDQVLGLLDRGHDVQVFPLNCSPPTSPPPIRRWPELAPRTHYPPPLPQRRPVRLLAFNAALARALPACPGAALRFAALYARRHAAIPPNLFHTLLHLLTAHFDLVHAHFATAANAILPVKLANPDLPLLATFHGYDINKHPLQAPPDVYADLFRLADRFTANTNFTKDQAIALGCPADRVLIHPMGLHLDDFPFAPPAYDPHAPVYLLTVGRLVEKKGHQFALRALAHLAPRFPNLRYRIAGDGPLRQSLEALARELDLLERVQFLGPCDRDRVRQLYRTSHLFCLPSVTAADGDREGQGLVIQEAQAAGLPVLTTRHNGIPDGVLEDRSAFLIPERDPDALAQRLAFLLENPQIWPEMGRTGRDFVEKNYNINLLNDRLVHIYHELLATTRS